MYLNRLCVRAASLPFAIAFASAPVAALIGQTPRDSAGIRIFDYRTSGEVKRAFVVPDTPASSFSSNDGSINTAGTVAMLRTRNGHVLASINKAVPLSPD